MPEIRTVAIIGAGAVGASYASLLTDRDAARVTIVSGGERAERYLRDGFRVNGREYRFPVARPDESPLRPDLFLVACKGHHLPSAITDMRPHLGPRTLIMSLLNGISSEGILGRALGEERVLPAMTIGIDAVRIGREVEYSKPGRIFFGEPDDSRSERTAAVESLLARAQIPCTVPGNMTRILWWKFMINVGINQASAVLRAPYAVFQRVPEARELMLSAMQEVLALSDAAGIGLGQADLEEWERTLSGLSPAGKTSMLQDVEAGRKTEVELFAGTVRELGREYGIATPVNDTLFRIIRAFEQGYGPQTGGSDE